MNQLNTWREELKLKQERLQQKFDAVPKINWEILSYANTHTKEEVLQKYSEHKDFIESINFNS